jgi:hypothetical protein
VNAAGHALTERAVNFIVKAAAKRAILWLALARLRSIDHGPDALRVKWLAALVAVAGGG